MNFFISLILFLMSFTFAEVLQVDYAPKAEDLQEMRDKVETDFKDRDGKSVEYQNLYKASKTDHLSLIDTIEQSHKTKLQCSTKAYCRVLDKNHIKLFIDYGRGFNFLNVEIDKIKDYLLVVNGITCLSVSYFNKPQNIIEEINDVYPLTQVSMIALSSIDIAPRLGKTLVSDGSKFFVESDENFQNNLIKDEQTYTYVDAVYFSSLNYIAKSYGDLLHNFDMEELKEYKHTYEFSKNNEIKSINDLKKYAKYIKEQESIK
ncbi:hypothetical protein [Candidatus Nesciobacter abundans]|uniref:Uncharacterized protein n=1 Tax=Candidatus Nesciobacter abundans TaxID=2601668 RepID=A0A5C0UG17_9PROT|nr:hypothetical protein [Candidatus Nesciobacter abundans]QEK38998.1 hypothetical protein FZC36_00925 [Candidatus Nesciobacter abundans]